MFQWTKLAQCMYERMDLTCWFSFGLKPRGEFLVVSFVKQTKIVRQPVGEMKVGWLVGWSGLRLCPCVR